jgi:hypothetical protein
MGLLLFGFVRWSLNRFPKLYDDYSVGTVIYWISIAVALYYAALAVAIYVYLREVFPQIIVFGLLSWGIGWAIRRACARAANRLASAPGQPVPDLPSRPFDANNPIYDPLSDLPPGSRIERRFRRRVAFLPDGTVRGETDRGLEDFPSFDDWRRSIGEWPPWFR